MPIFNSYRESIIIKDHVKAKHIIAGDYSYYSGYYHDKAFEDCVMYLDEADNHRDTGAIDRLIIGKFCSIATGVKFMMGGTQGHNYDWIAAYSLDFLDDDFDNYNLVAPKGQKLKGDTMIGNDVWIGAGASVLPGLNLAEGTVIGANAVVTKDTEPYSVMVGIPARVSRFR